jgi:hypothetical protein
MAFGVPFSRDGTEFLVLSMANKCLENPRLTIGIIENVSIYNFVWLRRNLENMLFRASSGLSKPSRLDAGRLASIPTFHIYLV